MASTTDDTTYERPSNFVPVDPPARDRVRYVEQDERTEVVPGRAERRAAGDRGRAPVDDNRAANIRVGSAILATGVLGGGFWVVNAFGVSVLLGGAGALAAATIGGYSMYRNRGRGRRYGSAFRPSRTGTGRSRGGTGRIFGGGTGRSRTAGGRGRTGTPTGGGRRKKTPGVLGKALLARSAGLIPRPATRAGRKAAAAAARKSTLPKVNAPTGGRTGTRRSTSARGGRSQTPSPRTTPRNRLNQIRSQRAQAPQTLSRRLMHNSRNHWATGRRVRAAMSLAGAATAGAVKLATWPVRAPGRPFRAATARGLRRARVFAQRHVSRAAVGARLRLNAARRRLSPYVTGRWRWLRLSSGARVRVWWSGSRQGLSRWWTSVRSRYGALIARVTGAAAAASAAAVMPQRRLLTDAERDALIAQAAADRAARTGTPATPDPAPAPDPTPEPEPVGAGDSYDTRRDGDTFDAPPPPLFPTSRPIPTPVRPNTDPRSNPMAAITDRNFADLAGYELHPAQEGLLAAHAALFAGLPGSVRSMVDHLEGLDRMYGDAADIIHGFGVRITRDYPLATEMHDLVSDIAAASRASSEGARETNGGYQLANEADLQRNFEPRHNEEWNDIPDGVAQGDDMAALRAKFLEALVETYTYDQQNPPDMRTFLRGMVTMYLTMGQHVEHAVDTMRFPGAGRDIAVYWDGLATTYVDISFAAQRTAGGYEDSAKHELARWDTPRDEEHLTNAARSAANR